MERLDYELAEYQRKEEQAMLKEASAEADVKSQLNYYLWHHAHHWGQWEWVRQKWELWIYENELELARALWLMLGKNNDEALEDSRKLIDDAFERFLNSRDQILNELVQDYINEDEE